MSSNRLLLISCYFPPAGGVQVQRALSLAKYLPQNGFEVHVLTTRNPAVPVYDPDLLEQVPTSVQVHRAWTLEPPFHLRKKIWHGLSKSKSRPPDDSHPPSRKGLKARIADRVTHLLCPDPQILWYPLALQRASQLIRDKQIKLVLVTAPPFSSFLLGCELKRRFPDVDLITDFRDEWLGYFANTFAFRGSDLVRKRSAEIERMTVELSQSVVSVTHAILQTLRTRYVHEPQSKFHLVPNGYDPEAFAGFHIRPHNRDRIVVTYVGTIYSPCSPAGYLDALDRLPEHIRSRFETRFVGRLVQEFDAGLLANRKSRITLTGFMPQRQALRYMEDTDYLLLPLSESRSVPGKLYEYLATGQPILGLVPPGSDAEAILLETRSGWSVNGDDQPAIERLLIHAFEMATQRCHQPNWKAIRKYERPRTIAAYGDIIRQRPVLADQSLKAAAGD